MKFKVLSVQGNDVYARIRIIENRSIYEQVSKWLCSIVNRVRVHFLHIVSEVSVANQRLLCNVSFKVDRFRAESSVSAGRTGATVPIVIRSISVVGITCV